MPDRSARPPVCLSIAGSDSGGGAGIQADLKAFAAAGVHGTTAITAITAQNTVAVTAVEAVSPMMIVAQVAAVAGDLGVDAVKVGMVGGVRAIEAVAGALDLLSPSTPVVVDPVMIAESGARLLEAEAQAALVELLLPRATVITPNLSEARALAGEHPPGDPGDHHTGDHAQDERSPEALARAIHVLGPQVVVVTGGHRAEGEDLFFDGHEIVVIGGPRHPDGAAHGSGCTHSSTLTAHLAVGRDPLEAAREARAAASAAVRDGLRGLGAGPGPVNVLGLRITR